MRMFRPFPVEQVRAAIGNLNGGRRIEKVAVLDRNISHGMGGIWTQEIKAALWGMSEAPKIFSYHIGLGGRDVTPEAIIEAYDHAKSHDRPEDTVWIGLKK
jgi:pyruvate/2-oxoacid:ferredoxin oxidoreductase alpha subunit